MNKNDIIFRLLKRAEIRRQIPTRKSVQEGKPDRIADLLEEAAAEIARLTSRTLIDYLDELDALVKDYHARDGTYNFHYSKYELVQWDVYFKREMTQEQWESLNVDDWIVRIVWTDNSNSTDVYSVPLKEILEWDEQRKNVQAGHL